eukprot:m.73964 g.73964  ORF g.73964 m.73964 type:complete len:59 (+) comp14347_c0_seq1:2673-2849(+)
MTSSLAQNRGSLNNWLCTCCACSVYGGGAAIPGCADVNGTLSVMMRCESVLKCEVSPS